MRKIILFLLLSPLFTSSQKLPGIEEKTKDLKKFEGFFDFYWDENTGKIWLEVDTLDTEILYTISLPAGLGSNDIGLDRGLPGGGRIIGHLLLALERMKEPEKAKSTIHKEIPPGAPIGCDWDEMN